MKEVKIVDGMNCIDEVKNLIIEYTKFLGRDLAFQNIDNELADIAKKYCPPNGKLICAQVEEKIIGCVAYHKFDAERCEMKRLFVLDGYRKFHVGSKLIEEILSSARSDGYKEILLDTITPLQSAIHLYKKFGFVETAPYYENPMPDVIYMKKILE